MKLFRRGVSAGPELDVVEVGKALVAVLDERSSWLTLDDQRKLGRVCGEPGSLDPFLLTDVWWDHGLVEIECRLPLSVPAEQRDAGLALCLWLNTGGRFAFGLDPDGTPFLRTCVHLREGWKSVAKDSIAMTLEMIMERGRAAETVFRAVANGTDVAGALKEVENELPFAVAPWSGEPPQGTPWVFNGDQVLAWPANRPIPRGYTEREHGATMATLFAISRDHSDEGNKGGFFDGCSGPVLIHADGAVECYGCSAPA